MILFSEIITRKKFVLEKGVHPTDAILAVVGGEFKCTMDKQENIVRPGDIFVFPKNVWFEREIIKPLTCIYIQFKSLSNNLPYGFFDFKDAKRISSTLQCLEKAIRENYPQNIINHFAEDIFYTYTLQNNMQTKNKIYGDIFAYVEYLEKNYHKKLNLSNIAQEFGLTKQGLIYKFKKQTGKTPIQYLNDIRINESKQLLKNTDNPVSSIAENCGFSDLYYFSSIFKKSTGMSPSQFRKIYLL